MKYFERDILNVTVNLKKITGEISIDDAYDQFEDVDNQGYSEV